MSLINEKNIKRFKKYPTLFKIVKKCYSLFYPIYYIKNLFRDTSKIKNNKLWYPKIKETQLNKKIPLYADRQSEIKKYFQKSNLDLIKYYLKHGFPNSAKFKVKLIDFFTNKTDSDNLLKKSYEQSSFHYVLRLMFAYERYSLIVPYLDYLVQNYNKPLKVFKILDYGCGVSDIGLLFSSLGSDVTIADLDDKKMDFTIWRFKTRNLEPTIIKINDPSDYPTLPESEYDLIIATELFEHVRNPLKLLKNFTSALKQGGYLFDSMGGHFEREIVGDHLKESIEIGQSDEYKQFYKNNYQQIFINEKLNWLFKKIV